jgi:hypothetical protein
VGRAADLSRLTSLRERWARRDCAAVGMLAEYDAGRPVAGLLRD